MVLQGGLCVKTFICGANVSNSSNVFSLFMRSYVGMKSEVLDVRNHWTTKQYHAFPTVVDRLPLHTFGGGL